MYMVVMQEGCRPAKDGKIGGKVVTVTWLRIFAIAKVKSDRLGSKCVDGTYQTARYYGSLNFGRKTMEK